MRKFLTDFHNIIEIYIQIGYYNTLQLHKCSYIQFAN